MIQKAIITGGTGVTGNALLRYLLEQNVFVTVLVRKGSQRIGNIPKHPNVKIVFFNLVEYDNIDPELSGESYDVFFHLAWDGSMGSEKVNNRYNVGLQMRNLEAFIQAVELCRRLKCSKFVATGSQAEYGRVNTVITENTPLQPETAYGTAKVCAHSMAEILGKQYGITIIWARLFSIYGPHDGAVSLVDSAIKELLNKKNSIPYSAGTQKWNYLYSLDAAKALYLLAQMTDKSDTFCVASSKGRPLKEYIECIHRTVDATIIPRLGEAMVSNTIELDVDISKLIQTIGDFEEYSFEKGILEILNDYKGDI